MVVNTQNFDSFVSIYISVFKTKNVYVHRAYHSLLNAWPWLSQCSTAVDVFYLCSEKEKQQYSALARAS